MVDGPGLGAVDVEAVARFRQRMDDDLDTPAALAGVFELARRANAAADAGDRQSAERAAMTAGVLAAALGLSLHGRADTGVDPVSADLVRRRDEARARRDWASADDLRQRLTALGWLVEDGPDGTRIRRP